MKYEAVFFDLFGTLVKIFSRREYEQVLARVAGILTAPEQDFARLWRETFDDRVRGAFPTTEAGLVHICRLLDIDVAGERVAAAAQLRFDYVRRSLVPRDDAVETLGALQAMGHKVGLISDCSPEIPHVWEETDLVPLVEAPVFSCAVGLKKPDPRIYHLACERLAVDPRACLYVGDGGSRELTGAAWVGMHPVLIRDRHERDAFRVDGEGWDGPTVSTLHEVLGLV
jgi:putative hydrolase of the HAD superfamily